jgi:hypothetical protein
MKLTKPSMKITEGGSYIPVPGYPLYEIDHTGSIRRIFKTKKVIMTPHIKDGHYVIRLTYKFRQRKEERVHKLMQLAFLPPAPPGHILYHKNGDKLDNYVNNLGYITRSELGKMTGAKSRRVTVAKVDQNGNIVETYPSARAAARANFMSYQTVMDRCNGKVKRKFALDGYNYVWDSDTFYDKELDYVPRETKLSEELPND